MLAEDRGHAGPIEIEHDFQSLYLSRFSVVKIEYATLKDL